MLEFTVLKKKKCVKKCTGKVHGGGAIMTLLVLDGNSIVNRAFYGIKLLSTKNGQFTNGIYGFLNILLRLEEETNPDGVAIAFDLKAPTFRHKLYDQYKAGRHAMPPELASQMPILKELLTDLGYKLVEQEGYEADDILGTLAKSCGTETQCFLATGDRDSLQLVRDNVTVLLAATRHGQPETVHYTPELVKETYGVTPPQLIEVKALMGDTSDHIPGVAGIGQKTAGALIADYNSIDYIYDHLDELQIKPGVRAKLEKDKDNAYLSRTLGTICTSVPMDADPTHYVVGAGDHAKAAKTLARLEMFAMIDKLGLRDEAVSLEASEEATESIPVKELNAFSDLLALLQIQNQEQAQQQSRAQQQNTDATLNSGSTQTQAVFTYHLEEGQLSELAFAIDGTIYYLDETADKMGFSAFLEDDQIAKFTAESKPLFHYGFEQNLTIQNVCFDASLAGYILNPSANAYDPMRLLEEYGKITPGKLAAEYDTDFLREAVALDCVKDQLLAQINDNDQSQLLTLEISLAEVLASMEHIGFLVDKDGLQEYGKVIAEAVDRLASRVYEQVGYEFNLNSPKQLGKALFEDLGLPAKKKTKSGYSTNAEVLEGLAPQYPVVADILEYRTVSKLKSTYCDGLLKVIGSDGRIHSTLNQTETRTGRISSSEPNLQNIPVRKPIGAELRKFFVAKPGYTLVDADYSQIELRVLAHMANDANMIAAFESGEDIHKITASQVFHVPLDYVTPQMRSNAKAVNFGIVYGIGAFSLSQDIGVTRKEAQQYIDHYLENFSGVDAYMKQVVEEAKENGFVTTLFQRRRYLPELSASNRMLRAFGERVARNAPIQGTAADIIKIAMVKVYHRLQAEQLDAQLIMQIHDELIVEAKDDIADKVCNIVKEEMEHACKMAVKLSVDAHTGKSWYDAKG